MFSPSIHELTACIYYKLVIERGIRGCNVDKEFDNHGQMGMQVPVDSDRKQTTSRCWATIAAKKSATKI